MIEDLLAIACRQAASDLHLVAGERPYLRVLGRLRTLKRNVLTTKEIETYLVRLMNETAAQSWQAGRETDFACELAGQRLRISAYRQRQGAAVAIRLIPKQIASLGALGFDERLTRLAAHDSGLICVAGAVGSGKSTTLAALVNEINQTQPKHILTLEDPIEYIHTSARALVTQRAVGEHSRSFQCALRSALRADPDVILAGELRDYETVAMTLSAAQTGHLVLTSLHTRSAAETLHRLLDFFPAEEKAPARSMLAESLQAVIAQKLLTSRDGQTRVPAYELLIVTPAIRHLIREMKVAQINTAIQTGERAGMQSLEQHIALLTERGLIA